MCVLGAVASQGGNEREAEGMPCGVDKISLFWMLTNGLFQEVDFLPIMCFFSASVLSFVNINDKINFML